MAQNIVYSASGRTEGPCWYLLTKLLLFRLLAFKVYGKKKFEIQSIYQYITFNFFGF